MDACTAAAEGVRLPADAIVASATADDRPVVAETDLGQARQLARKERHDRKFAPLRNLGKTPAPVETTEVVATAPLTEDGCAKARRNGVRTLYDWRGQRCCRSCHAATTRMRAVGRERGFFRITISMSRSRAVRNVSRRSTEKPSSL